MRKHSISHLSSFINETGSRYSKVKVDRYNGIVCTYVGRFDVT